MVGSALPLGLLGAVMGIREREVWETRRWQQPIFLRLFRPSILLDHAATPIQHQTGIRSDTSVTAKILLSPEVETQISEPGREISLVEESSALLLRLTTIDKRSKGIGSYYLTISNIFNVTFQLILTLRGVNRYLQACIGAVSYILYPNTAQIIT